MRKAKNALDHVDKSLAKVRAKPWAEPLGKTLEISSKIVDGLGCFVPGVSALGGALSFGATLLNPEPSNKDLQKDLQVIKDALGDLGLHQVLKTSMLKEQKSLEARIANPEGEIRANFAEVRGELNEVFKVVGESSNKMAVVMTTMQDKVSKTFNIVTDTRYRVGVLGVNAFSE